MMLVKHLQLQEHAQQNQVEVVKLEQLVLQQQFKQLVSQIHQEVPVIGMEQLV